ncbi:hypothetical protein HHK36_026705 [Tetracentron sinense]|uniref:Uncharacterized protein n=1 Tax=Tetracentron sinense TaxID=13715 RepID=A0A835D5Q8_TETSI|nr:hypothetical protein HHK36_026705 [Tetracentron sinense]
MHDLEGAGATCSLSTAFGHSIQSHGTVAYTLKMLLLEEAEFSTARDSPISMDHILCSSPPQINYFCMSSTAWSIPFSRIGSVPKSDFSSHTPAVVVSV